MPDPNAKPTAVRDLRGTVAAVLAKLDTDHALSPELNAYLKAKLAACPHAGVTVNAHELQNAGNWHISLSLTKLFAWLLVFFVLPSAFATLTSSNLVTYAATGGASTNTGNLVYLGSAYLTTQPSFIVSDGGTATTNDLIVRVKYGAGTNAAAFTTAATYTKPTTNAAEAVITPGSVRLDIYAITEIVTTNNVTVGTKAILTQ